MTADQDVSNNANGNAGPGTPSLPWALVAYFYNAHMFGRAVDYAFPEGSNVSSSRWDHMTSLAKLLTRTYKMPDQNEYDLFDAIMTITKATILANPHINDDCPLSVNYKPPAADALNAPFEESATKRAVDAETFIQAEKHRDQ